MRIPELKRTPGASDDTSMRTPAKNHLALRVHVRLATCRNVLMRQSRRSVSRWQLTLPQFDVLAELARASDPGFSFVELSRLLLVTSGNLTGVVDRLEAEGLVRREPDPADRRVIRIKLTDKGRRLTQKILRTHADDVQSALSFMPRDRLELLSELLGELREGLRESRNANNRKRLGLQRSPERALGKSTPVSKVAIALSRP